MMPATTNPALASHYSLRDTVFAGDCDAVRILVTRTGFFHADEIDIAVELVDEHLAHGTASDYYFVFVEIAEELAGYACYGPIPCTKTAFDLYWIAVEPRYQRHGLGRVLVAEVEKRVASAGGDRIYIDTSGRADYAPTRAFYERSGFHRAAELTDFYARGDDRVIYAKYLAPG